MSVPMVLHKRSRAVFSEPEVYAQFENYENQNGKHNNHHHHHHHHNQNHSHSHNNNNNMMMSSNYSGENSNNGMFGRSGSGRARAHVLLPDAKRMRARYEMTSMENCGSSENSATAANITFHAAALVAMASNVDGNGNGNDNDNDNDESHESEHEHNNGSAALSILHENEEEGRLSRFHGPNKRSRSHFASSSSSGALSERRNGAAACSSVPFSALLIRDGDLQENREQISVTMNEVDQQQIEEIQHMLGDEDGQDNTHMIQCNKRFRMKTSFAANESSQDAEEVDIDAPIYTRRHMKFVEAQHNLELKEASQGSQAQLREAQNEIERLQQQLEITLAQNKILKRAVATQSKRDTAQKAEIQQFQHIVTQGMEQIRSHERTINAMQVQLEQAEQLQGKEIHGSRYTDAF